MTAADKVSPYKTLAIEYLEQVRMYYKQFGVTDENDLKKIAMRELELMKAVVGRMRKGYDYQNEILTEMQEL